MGRIMGSHGGSWGVNRGVCTVSTEVLRIYSPKDFSFSAKKCKVDSGRVMREIGRDNQSKLGLSKGCGSQ